MSEKIEFSQLLEQLHDQRDWRVRQKAIQPLSEYKTEEAIQAILGALYDESIHVIEVAARYLGDIGTQAVPSLIAELHTSQDTPTRNQIIHILARIGDRRALPDIIQALDDPNSGAHYSAARALSSMPDRMAVPRLIELLEQEENDQQKDVFVRALAVIGDPAAVPALTPLLYNKDQWIRRISANALGKIKDETSLQALLEASRSEIGDVRYNVAEGLGLKHDERAFERLAELLSDSYDLTRAMAAKAIGQSDPERAAPYLLKMLDDPSSNVQNFLKSALGSLKTLNVVPIMMTRHRNALTTGRMGESEGLYLFARDHWKFEERGDIAVQDALEALSSQDERLRIAAVWLLYNFNSQLWDEIRHWADQGKKRSDFPESVLHSQVMETLIALLKDSNPDIRLSVMEPLLRTSDERATENLIACLQDQDELIVWNAAAVLGTTRDPRAVSALIDVCHSDNEFARNRAISSLSQIGGDSALYALIDLLAHPDERTRQSAAFGLGNLKDQRATPFLIEKLKQEPLAWVKEWIAIGLGYLADKRATSVLLDTLKNPGTDDPGEQFRLRAEVVRALASMRDETALEALYNEVNQSSDWSIRNIATSAIGMVGTPHERANRLFELLGHEHDNVRTTAAKDLGYLGAGTDDLDLRDYIVSNLIERLQDTGAGYHWSPTVAHMAAKSLFYVGTSEAIEVLKHWKLKSAADDEKDNPS